MSKIDASVPAVPEIVITVFEFLITFIPSSKGSAIITFLNFFNFL